MRRIIGKMSWLLLATIFYACGQPFSNKKGLQNSDPDYPFYIKSFDPPAGQRSELPASITVTFNSSSPNRDSLSSLTHYYIDCGTGSIAAEDVDHASGYSSVTITLPDLAPGSGAICTFSVAGTIADDAGNFLEGSRSVIYSIVN